MNLKTLKIAVFVVVLLETIACNSKKQDKAIQTEKPQIKQLILSASEKQPIENFYDALLAFDNDDNEQCALHIEKGVQFIQMVGNDADSLNKSSLEKQIVVLTKLCKKVEDNEMVSSSELKRAFENTNRSLAKYAIQVTETLVDMDVPEDAIQTTHSAYYYLQQAQKNAENENQGLYQEGIDELKEIEAKSKEEFGKEKITIKDRLNKLKMKLHAIDGAMEGPVPL